MQHIGHSSVPTKETVALILRCLCVWICVRKASHPLEVEVQHHLTPILTQEVTGILVSSGFRITTLFSVLSFFWTHQPQVLQAFSQSLTVPFGVPSSFLILPSRPRCPYWPFLVQRPLAIGAGAQGTLEELLVPAQGELDVRLLKLRPDWLPQTFYCLVNRTNRVGLVPPHFNKTHALPLKFLFCGNRNGSFW